MLELQDTRTEITHQKRTHRDTRSSRTQKGHGQSAVGILHGWKDARVDTEILKLRLPEAAEAKCRVLWKECSSLHDATTSPTSHDRLRICHWPPTTGESFSSAVGFDIPYVTVASGSPRGFATITEVHMECSHLLTAQ